MTHLLLFLFPLLPSNHPVYAQEVNAHLDSLIRTGIHSSILQDYAAATRIFVNLKKEMPRHPAGYFFQAAVLQTQMMDYENYADEDHFVALIDSAITLARQQIKSDMGNAWTYFYMGAGHGYLSFYLAKQKKYWPALRNARKSVKFLSKAVSLDSTLYDAYLGIGWYRYYRSKISRHFAWLPFVKNERDSGIAMIKKSMSRSRYSRTSAMNGLCWILHDEDRFEEGIALAETGLSNFPHSRVFLWCAARLSEKLQRWQDAANYYERILASFAAENIQSPLNELTCRKKLTHLYLKLRNQVAAKRQCEMAGRIQFEPRGQQSYKKELKQLQQTCKTLPEASPEAASQPAIL